MKAQIGERLLFRGKKVGSADHTAEVLQVRGDDGGPSVPRPVRGRPRAARLPRDGLPGPARRPPRDQRGRHLEAETKDPTLAAVNRGPTPAGQCSLMPAGSGG